jgi:hypothetical protein
LGRHRVPEQLRRHLCGCAEGAAFLVVALTAVAALALLSWTHTITFMWTWPRVVIAGASCLGAPIVGKGYGLAVARRRLRRNVTALHSLAVACGSLAGNYTR